MATHLCCPVDKCSHLVAFPASSDSEAADDEMVQHIMRVHQVPEISAAWHTTHAQTITKVGAV